MRPCREQRSEYQIVVAQGFFDYGPVEFVDVEHGRICRAGIKTFKGKSGAILFSDNVKPLVKKYLASENEFAKYSMEALRGACDNLFDMLEMKRHVLSACRTSCATILASAGVAEEEIKTIMRHANINITRKFFEIKISIFCYHQ